jgi:hypothetical protein
MHTTIADIDEVTVHDEITVGKDIRVLGYTDKVPVYRTFFEMTEMQARAHMITPFVDCDRVTVYTGRKTFVGMHVYEGEALDWLPGIFRALMDTEGISSIEVTKWRYES